MAGRSYVNDTAFSSADTDLWKQWPTHNNNNARIAARYPHAYRWYLHIHALMRFQNTEQSSRVIFFPTSGDAATNERKRRHSDELSSTHLKKEVNNERATRKETLPILFTIQIQPRHHAELQDDKQRLWEKVIQTKLPEEIQVKWGEFFTWIPDKSQPDKRTAILQTTFVSRIPRGDENGSWDGIRRIVNAILEGHPEDVELCEITSQTPL